MCIVHVEIVLGPEEAIDIAGVKLHFHGSEIGGLTY